MLDDVHRRYNPLTDEWVLVSPHRTARPWQGQVEDVAPARASHDPDCYLCPGNARAGGVRNPDYDDVFVFDNDFPALLTESATAADAGGASDELLRAAPVRGTCRVVCFSPRHDLSLGELPANGLRRVVDTWAEQTAELSEHFAWVQCFENRGAMMGCSSPHPHGQIWATDTVPTLVAREQARQQAHHGARGTRLLDDVLAQELARGERVVLANEEWVLLVPWWARWPFETLLLPRRSVPRLDDLDDAARDGLADILGPWMAAQDNLFRCDFPYSFGWHGAPRSADAATRDAWTLHAHCYPPLLRSASVRKFMVGYELLAEAQRDLTPEAAAARLREVVGPHWRRAEA